MPSAFSKYFEGKIFTNGYRLKFVKIFPLEKTRYTVFLRCVGGDLG